MFSTYPITVDPNAKGHDMSETTRARISADQLLARALRDVHAIVPPLWPLADYVAVNPCVGLTDRSFLGARQLLRNVRDCDLLMPREYFQAIHEAGRLSARDLAAAHAQCVKEHPLWYRRFDPSELTEWLNASDRGASNAEIRFRTVAEAVDQHQGSSWSSHIINDITRHCGAHFDEGQATWASPWKDAPLYTGWREAAQLGRRMDLLGLPGFRAFVARLPPNPEHAVKELLIALEVPPSHWRNFLLCQVFSVAGWASHIRYRVREAEHAGETNQDLIGLTAMRLAYDVALARAPGIPWPLPLWPADADLEEGIAVPPAPTTDVLARHVLQVAVEGGYRRELLRKFATRSAAPRSSKRKALQIVFCIDVRSEIMRRNLESVDESIETFGFAGFFGLPLEYLEIGCTKGTAQCPVLLQPGFQVHERLRGISDAERDDATRKRIAVRHARTLWKSFQTSATSCFSYVESLGLPYFGKLLTDSLHWTRPVASADSDGLSENLVSRLGPDIHAEDNRGLDANRRIDLAEGMLRNLGLTSGFARIVALCGHASDVTNNPYRAALDCGACGGHSGEPNARVAAVLLNDIDVRIGLISRGIEIPNDTWFVAAVHNTTTDEITLRDASRFPASHAEEHAQIEIWLREAGRLSRIERCPRLGSSDAADVFRRGRDWAEVRPEWGLAGNAAFIVAPRSRTVGLNLGGRAFMHSYEHRLDPDLKVLELIMTAPMIVANWINMQYFASTVDPAAFGSGNKVIHNVVGQFGVLQGNGGDLMTGLPWQSVHDGKTLQHEPLRLLVVIEAPRQSVQHVIAKHALVRDLVTNGWVTLAVLDECSFFRWTSTETWVEELVVTDAAALTPELPSLREDFS
jgi:uncharacterized protein